MSSVSRDNFEFYVSNVTLLSLWNREANLNPEYDAFGIELQTWRDEARRLSQILLPIPQIKSLLLARRRCVAHFECTARLIPRLRADNRVVKVCRLPGRRYYSTRLDNALVKNRMNLTERVRAAEKGGSFSRSSKTAKPLPEAARFASRGTFLRSIGTSWIVDGKALAWRNPPCLCYPRFA